MLKELKYGRKSVLDAPQCEVSPSTFNSLARTCREYCDRHKVDIPEWARIRKRGRNMLENKEQRVYYVRKFEKRGPLDKPSVVTNGRIDIARRYAKEHNLPIPEWAAYKKRRSPLEEPSLITKNNKTYARKYARDHGLPIPDWAKPKVAQNPNADDVERKPVTEKPEVVTRYAVKKCRAYCAQNGIKIPEWAELFHKRKKRQTQSKPESIGRNKYTSCLVLTDITLALRSGMECYWNNVEKIVHALEDDALTEAVKTRSESAFTEVMRVCLEINPKFGYSGNHDRVRKSCTNRSRNYSTHGGSVTEQREHWRQFTDKNGEFIKSPIGRGFFYYGDKTKGR